MAIGSPRAIIHLGHRLLGGSSDLPECWHHEPDAALEIERLTLLDLAPDGVCRGEQSPVPWWALTPPFHPYLPSRNLAGGIFSVPLSVALGLGCPRATKTCCAWPLASTSSDGVRTFLWRPCSTQRSSDPLSGEHINLIAAPDDPRRPINCPLAPRDGPQHKHEQSFQNLDPARNPWQEPERYQIGLPRC